MLLAGAFFGLRSIRPEPVQPSGAGALGGVGTGLPAAAVGHAQMGSVDEGHTVKIMRPSESQGTLQLLPGRLEITGGPDKGNLSDIRFVRDKVNGGPVPEITFGRSGEPTPTHVVLKSKTVSRLHARLRYEGNQWNITNHSDTNPVMINGTALASGSSSAALKQGDSIEMGEVAFRFHAS